MYMIVCKQKLAKNNDHNCIYMNWLQVHFVVNTVYQMQEKKNMEIEW